jgi:sulfate permease, SulP family
MAADRSNVSSAKAFTCKLCKFDFLPIKRSFKGYDKHKAVCDLKAGMNVALLAFPQSMAYAVIAGLPIYYGLFTEIVAGIVGPIFSGSRFLIAGATNATAVLFFATVLSLGLAPDQVLVIIPLLLLMVGFFLIIGSLVGIANFIQFVSRSVITGYITAAAFYIIVNQFSKVIGVHVQMERGFSLFGLAWKTVAAIPSASIPTVLLSCITGGVYWLMQKRLPKWPNVAVVLFLMSILAIFFDHALARTDLFGGARIAHLDAISVSSWKLHVPQFSVADISLLAQASLVIAFLCMLEASSVGKSVAARAGEKFDVKTEILGVGAANIASALWGGMPVSGSPVRSQLNWSSGGHTALAPIVSGVFVSVGVFFLGPYTRFIPTCALGTLIVFIGFTLINQHVIRVVVKSTRSDAAVFIVTFVAALVVRLDFAIILGAVTSIALFLRKAAVPQLVEYGTTDTGELAPIAVPEVQKDGRQTIVVMHVEGDLFFGAAELFRDQMRRICEDKGLKIIILKLRNAHNLDATSILALEELIRYMRENGRTLLVSEARSETLRIFERSGLMELVGKENIFPDDPQNSTMPTAKALRRAKEIMHTKDAHISIILGVEKQGRMRP